MEDSGMDGLVKNSDLVEEIEHIRVEKERQLHYQNILVLFIE